MVEDYAHKERPPDDAVADWLSRHHGTAVHALTPLRGGYWSSAWSYRAGGEDLVLRLGADDAGYRIDAAAHDFAAAGVPVPEVLHIGPALGRQAAISRRHDGTFIEEHAAADADRVGEALAELLAAFRRVPGRSRTEWYRPDGTTGWADWLLPQLERPADLATQWASAATRHPSLDPTFQAAVAEVQRTLPTFPERRDLIHGDLFHQNVLLDDRRVSGVFSWKLSAFGDFMFDVAFCSLWRPWFPVVAGADVWRRTLEAPDLTDDDLADAELRHRTYQLHIAAAHVLWFVRSDEDDHLSKLLALMAELLDV